MAELVDELVSNTSGSNAVPVRFRLRVLKQSESESETARTSTLALFSQASHSHPRTSALQNEFSCKDTTGDLLPGDLHH